VPLEDILNIRAFDPLQNKALTAEFSSSNSASSATSAVPLLIQVDADGQIVRKTVKLNQKKSKLSAAAAKILSERSKHDVQTVSLVAHSALDLDLFNHWISRLLGDKGGDIYRMKGILWMHGYDEQFVVHGVHMIFDGQRGQSWDSVSGGVNNGDSEHTSGLSSLGGGRKCNTGYFLVRSLPPVTSDSHQSSFILLLPQVPPPAVQLLPCGSAVWCSSGWGWTAPPWRQTSSAACTSTAAPVLAPVADLLCLFVAFSLHFVNITSAALDYRLNKFIFH